MNHETIRCGACRRDLPPEAFRPSARRDGSYCRSCHAADERQRQMYWSGLSPAEALIEVWKRIKRGRRVPRDLARRVDQLTAGAAA